MATVEALVIEGQFYDGVTSRPTRAEALIVGSSLELSFPDGGPSDVRRRYERTEIRISSRLGNTPRSIALPGGAKLETEDNETVDEVERAWGGSEMRAHLFESNVPLALSALVLLVALSVVAFIWGIPSLAKHIAYSMSDDVAYQLGQGTLKSLDQVMFDPSELPRERKDELRKGFEKMAQKYPRLPLHLEFRKANMPNAFALPDGTVVLTDELVDVVESDDEIYAVLAHEIGHVEHRHGARMALEGSAVGLLVMVVLGDASQAAGVAGSLPAVYANATFSREHETEADTFALEYMKRTGQNPEAFARALEHLTEKAQDREGDVFQYLSSHPATGERIARFRN